ncbi:MAG: hypothetical protein LAP21_18150 [Acidobacteriia bacterium]|nr:hypothetical protein [Terriglobia bacterium]
MRERKISLPGLLAGLAAGLLVWLLTSQFAGWVLMGLAIVIVFVAVRRQRGKTQNKHVGGNVTSFEARS